MRKYRRLKRCMCGFLSRYWLLLFWLALVFGVFTLTYMHYQRGPQYYYLRQILGSGLCISRGCGTIINLSCAIILFPISPVLLTFLRKFVSAVPIYAMKAFLNRSKSIHITCAFTIVSASVIHTVSHILNAVNFCQYFNSDYPDLNGADFSGQSPLKILFATVPGITGMTMMAILLGMVLMSLKYVRANYYNMFWCAHRVFILFFIFLICHPMSGMLKKQVNIDSHPPGCILANVTTEDLRQKVNYASQFLKFCWSPPQFIAQKSMTWLWIGVPLIAYLVDCLCRYWSRRQPVKLMKINYLPCSVIELTLKKLNFSSEPGQYVFLHCPAIAAFEWHPFSISNCLSQLEDCFTIHIKVAGDWSKQLHDKLMHVHHQCCHVVMPHSFSFRLNVDGPFGSPFQDILRSPLSICIAGGIGVTPFAAVLQSINTDAVDVFKLQRLHFVWVCTEVQAFLWFASLLCEVHFKLWHHNRPDIFDIQLFATRSQSLKDIQNFFSTYPLLRQRIKLHRPNWANIFQEWTTMYPKKRLNIFCSGPHSLNVEIRKHCDSYGVNGNSRLTFYHESFA